MGHNVEVSGAQGTWSAAGAGALGRPSRLPCYASNSPAFLRAFLHSISFGYRALTNSAEFMGGRPGELDWDST